MPPDWMPRKEGALKKTIGATLLRVRPDGLVAQDRGRLGPTPMVRGAIISRASVWPVVAEPGSFPQADRR